MLTLTKINKGFIIIIIVVVIRNNTKIGIAVDKLHHINIKMEQ